jgi:hypothetical protein
MTLATLLVLGGIALTLVALNFALQRLARPDQGNTRIAGCCGMALPNEITKSHFEENNEH